MRVSWGAGDTGAMLITSRNFDDRKTTEIISIEQQLPDQARLGGGQKAGAVQVRGSSSCYCRFSGPIEAIKLPASTDNAA